MATAMKHAGYTATGDGYRQQPRQVLQTRVSARNTQNPVKNSFGLSRVGLGRSVHPTCTEALLLHGDCLVGTKRHISAILDENLRDTVDSGVCGGGLYAVSPRGAFVATLPRSPSTARSSAKMIGLRASRSCPSRSRADGANGANG